jgi:4-hydroxybenzoate polyprenyltransferase
MTSDTTQALVPPRKSGTVLLALARSVRPHQWVKNLVCFAGLIFSGNLFSQEKQLQAVIAFAAFSAAASAVYLFNDYLDRYRDRTNPRTADRPLASGTLPVWLAAVALVGLLSAAVVLTFTLGVACGVVLGTYFALNIGYSVRLKKTVIADVICIALGFVLRVLFGVYAVQVLPSPWVVLCMFFLALFLGFSKRRGELVSLGLGAGTARPVLDKYTPHFLDLAIGVTATLTITTYTLYCVAPHHDPTMVVTVLPVVYCVLRYAHQVLVENRGQSPERLLYADRMLWVGVVAWVALAVFVIYARPGLFIPKAA